jgi:hypothetical protein
VVWVRLDDHFDEHPKIASVGPLGLALWVTALAYCNRNLTDGFIPASVASRLLAYEFEEADGRSACVLIGGEYNADPQGQLGFLPDRYYLPELLVGAGLWEHAKGGYQVHDYADFQPTRVQVEAERATKAAAGRAGGIAAATARAMAERQQNASRTPADAVAKSKPVPDPVPDPDPVPFPSPAAVSEPAAVAAATAPAAAAAIEPEPFATAKDAGWRDRYGTLVTAIGGAIDARMADECAQIADDHSLESITAAVRKVRGTGQRVYPSRLFAILRPPTAVADGKDRSPPADDPWAEADARSAAALRSGQHEQEVNPGA